jgi:hypothetical protein
MRHAGLAPIALSLLLLPSAGCVKSRPLVVRNAFASSYWCPVNQIEVHAEPGSDRLYHVTGCGLEITYDCGDTGDARACEARERIEFEATDGTSRGGWQEEETTSNHGMSREAALASAAHDLPCDRASLHILGADEKGFPNVVEGCGQRVTYQIADVDDQPATSPSAPVKKHKYVVINRLTLAPPPAAPSSAGGKPVSAPSTPPPPPPSAAAPPVSSAPPPAPVPAPSAPLNTPR